jgi:hypothetical protein
VEEAMSLVGQIIGFVILVAISVWVYKDAEQRGMGTNAYLWAIGTFLLCIIVLPIYLIVRNKQSA